jgi:AAA+ ATPase superfamily predicted ATPase
MTCFDRDEEITELWRHFKHGHNLLMLAPRRIGKTVLLNHLSRRAAENGFRAILLDVEGFREEKAFFRACCSAIQEELSTGAKVLTAFTDRLNQLLRGNSGGACGGDWRQWLVQTDWQEFADHLFAHLDAHNEDAPWLVLVDELPVFIQALQEKGGPEAISGFLYWLRSMRQKYRRIRWLYTGSIGLDTIARRNHVEGALNDLEAFTLKPFSEATARAFLADIAKRRGCGLAENAAEAILRRLGWLSPYYLERIAEDACAFAPAGGALTLMEAEAAMNQLLELDKRLYWSSWREHLDRNFNEPERGRLYTVLETVARNQRGVDRSLMLTALNRGGDALGEAVLRDLLDTLLSDGYLILETGGRCRFRMNLLREWWLRYVVL